jgi:hypothetical protein
LQVTVHAADVVENAMTGRGAFFGLGDRPVIEPDDRVPLRVAAGRYRDRPAVAVEDDQRAGGIEADALDRRPVGAGRGERAAHRVADRLPDVGRALLGMLGLRAVHPDRLLGATQQTPAAIENPGARTSGADVDRNHEVAHDRLRSVAGLPPRATRCRSGVSSSSCRRRR